MSKCCCFGGGPVCACGHSESDHHAGTGRCYGCRNELCNPEDRFALDKLVETEQTPGEPGRCSGFRLASATAQAEVATGPVPFSLEEIDQERFDKAAEKIPFDLVIDEEFQCWSHDCEDDAEAQDAFESLLELMTSMLPFASWEEVPTFVWGGKPGASDDFVADAYEGIEDCLEASVVVPAEAAADMRSYLRDWLIRYNLGDKVPDFSKAVLLSDSVRKAIFKACYGGS